MQILQKNCVKMAADDEETKTLTDVFRNTLKNDKLEVKVEKLKNENVAAMIHFLKRAVVCRI